MAKKFQTENQEFFSHDSSGKLLLPLRVKDNELDLTKQFYNKKLEDNAEVQEEQRREWAALYEELVREIKSLKGEIDNLGGENQSLMSSLGIRSRR